MIGHRLARTLIHPSRVGTWWQRVLPTLSRGRVGQGRQCGSVHDKLLAPGRLRGRCPSDMAAVFRCNLNGLATHDRTPVLNLSATGRQITLAVTSFFVARRARMLVLQVNHLQCVCIYMSVQGGSARGIHGCQRHLQLAHAAKMVN